MKSNKRGMFLMVFSICIFLVGCTEFLSTLATTTEAGDLTTTETEPVATTLITTVETTMAETTVGEETTMTTVTTAEQTAEEILNAAAALLDVPEEITSQAGFFLFYTDEVVTVDWVSDNEDVIDVIFIGGEAQMYQTTIHRPATVDATVTLTATITYGSETKIVNFAILVIAENLPDNLLAEDMEDLIIADQVESSMVVLPGTGLNGSAIAWELTPTEYASLIENELTLECVGTDYMVTLTATLSLGELTDSKEISVHVAMANYATLASLISTPRADVITKGTVFFFYSHGFFLFDETGYLNIYTGADWSSTVALGDVVILRGNMVNGIVGWELWQPELETIVSSGNPYAQTTQEYIFGVSFPRNMETWIITGRVEVIQSIVYIYSGAVVRIAIIEQSTYNDSYNALKAHAGQTISIRAANYYFYSSCYGFLYQEGAAGITVIG